MQFCLLTVIGKEGILDTEDKRITEYCMDTSWDGKAISQIEMKLRIRDSEN